MLRNIIINYKIAKINTISQFIYTNDINLFKLFIYI